MTELELTAGTMEYADTGGAGPVLVLLHGVCMDGSVWRHVVAELGPDYRCVVPSLPLGSHRRPMRPDADLSVVGVLRLVAEFLDRLDLRDATVVMNDWGGPQALVAEGLTDRIGRLAFVACEAFDNFPAGLPGRRLVRAAKLPGGLLALARLARLRPARDSLVGWMSKHGVPDDVVTGWFAPLADSAGVRRDLRKFGAGLPAEPVRRKWADALSTWDRPALVVWAPEDRMMPPDQRRPAGRRPAERPAGRGRRQLHAGSRGPAGRSGRPPAGVRSRRPIRDPEELIAMTTFTSPSTSNRPAASASRRTATAGLVVAAAGIAVLYVAGVAMPVVPPGFVLLLVAAGLVAFTRWRWTPFVAIAIAVFEAIPLAVGILGGDTVADLVDVGAFDVLAGTWLRLIGVVVTLVAAPVAAAAAYRRRAAVVVRP